MREAFDWQHGVFLAATMSSEKTAAAAGTVGELRFDPFAMLPFCGYDMADYFAHWLQIGQREPAKPPKIFDVNWFRKDAQGRFLWPGYGENSRVLAWMFRRCDDAARGVKTPIGLIPTQDDLDLTGLNLAPTTLNAVLSVDRAAVRAELPQITAYLTQFGERLPHEFHRQLAQLQSQLNSDQANLA